VGLDLFDVVVEWRGRWVVLLCQRKSLREILFDVVELGAALLGEEKSLNQREKNKVAAGSKEMLDKTIFSSDNFRKAFQANQIRSLSLSFKEMG